MIETKHTQELQQRIQALQILQSLATTQAETGFWYTPLPTATALRLEMPLPPLQRLSTNA